jgi:hypothetical protein
MSRRSIALVAALAIALAALVAGCGGSPSSEGGKKGTVSREGAKKLQAVYAKVKGLSPAERRKTLLKLADEEGGELSVYGSANLDEARRPIR